MILYFVGIVDHDLNIIHLSPYASFSQIYCHAYAAKYNQDNCFYFSYRIHTLNTDTLELTQSCLYQE